MKLFIACTRMQMQCIYILHPFFQDFSWSYSYLEVYLRLVERVTLRIDLGRFSELTLKCWYCSIYSLRQIDSTTVPLGPRYKCNEVLGSDPERNQGIWWLKFSILASSLTISCTLLLVKLIIWTATRSSILGEDNLQFKTDKTVLPCTKRYLWSFKKLLSYFMLL